MKLKTIDVTILLLLGIACVARATWGLFKDIYVDLSKSKSVTGVVTDADIMQIERVTFKSKKYSTVFGLKLDNSSQNFAVDRGIDVCKYLKANISIGDTVKLLYRLSSSDQNSFVFQITKGENNLANYSDYRRKEVRMIILAYIFGFLILSGLTAWYINKKKKARLPQ